MKIDEKLELLARAIRGEAKIEVNFSKNNERDWQPIKWLGETRMFCTERTVSSIDELFNQFIDIREVKKLPLLTQVECEFLKWFPQDWWIARNLSQDVSIYQEKPYRDLPNNSHWLFKNNPNNAQLKPSSLFTGIKWSDEDCYTIGELIAYAKENN